MCVCVLARACVCNEIQWESVGVVQCLSQMGISSETGREYLEKKIKKKKKKERKRRKTKNRSLRFGVDDGPGSMGETIGVKAVSQ